MLWEYVQLEADTSLNIDKKDDLNKHLLKPKRNLEVDL